MKKLVILTATFAIVFFSACKKDPLEIPLGTISVSIDGTKTTFNVQSKAVRTNTTGTYTLSIEGYKKDPVNSSTKMKLIISGRNPITSGTFTPNTSSGGTFARIEFFQEFIFGFGTLYVSSGSSSNPVIITLSELSGSSTKGIFKGELLVSGVSGTGEKVVLKDGVFNVRL